MDYRFQSSLSETQNIQVNSWMDYVVSWELRKGCLHHLIRRRTDKWKELTKLSQPISIPSLITTKTTGIAYYL
jgi:hypothetical protein